MKKKWRGGYIHNRVLLEPIAKLAGSFNGVSVEQEAAIKVGDRILYGDLLVQFGHLRILIEAELTTKRLGNVMAKAAAVAPCELWIVVPNRQIRESVKRQLSTRQLIPAQGVNLIIPLLSQALQRLTAFSELISQVECRNGKERKTINQIFGGMLKPTITIEHKGANKYEN